VNEDKPEWDESLGKSLLGALVLVGITRDEQEESVDEQFFGMVENATAEGIVLSLQGSRAGGYYNLPPDPRAFLPARPGTYRLRSTGETVENPDYTASWTIVSGD
jgi:hypothetical protein